MSHELKIPPSVAPGDRVAVLSASWPAPAHFPAVHEQAMQRLRTDFGLEPVEFGTTRRAGSPQERAADIDAAFADPSIRAVLATIGGDDQITVRKHLDPRLPVADPKPFVGYSDNTNLLNWLWYHGVAGVHGGSTQVHLGPGLAIDEQHLKSLRCALFGGEVTLRPVARSRDVGISWDDPRSLTDRAPDEEAEPWTWHGPAGVVSGPTWGGNIEVLQWNLAAGRWIRPAESYAGCVLVLEASEERPSAEQVYRMLRTMGERGLLSVCPALVWGRPPVGDHDTRPSAAEAMAARQLARDAVLRAVSEYNPQMLVVLDVDLGHTSPQWIVPYGGRLTVDGDTHEITAHFGPSNG